MLNYSWLFIFGQQRARQRMSYSTVEQRRMQGGQTGLLVPLRNLTLSVRNVIDVMSWPTLV